MKGFLFQTLGSSDGVFLLEMSWTITVWSCSATEDPLEGLSELWAEYCVDYWIQSGVEVAQPEKKTKEGKLIFFHVGESRKYHKSIFSPKYLLIDAVLADGIENS